MVKINSIYLKLTFIVLGSVILLLNFNCKPVQIEAPTQEPIISLKDVPRTLSVGDIGVFKSVVSSSESSRTVLWSSSKPYVLFVSKSGQYAALDVDESVQLTAMIESTGVSTTISIDIEASQNPPVKIQIIDAPSTLNLGDIGKFSSIVSPLSNTNDLVEWISSDPSILYVSKTGQYAVLGVGPVSVTVTLQSNKETSATVSLSTLTFQNPATNIQIIDPPSLLNVGDAGNFLSVVSPSREPDDQVTWTTDKPNVLSVDASSGQYSAKAAGGPVRITASIVVGTTTISSFIDVNVTTSTQLQIVNAPRFLAVGNSDTLSIENSASIEGETISWSSSADSVLSIDASSGVYTAKAVGGPVQITVTLAPSGISSTVEISVLGVEISNVPPIVDIGDSGTSRSRISPTVHSGETVQWSSNNPNVLSVNTSTGQYSAKAVGSVRITVTISGTSISNFMEVKVVDFRIGNAPRYVVVGDSDTLTFINPIGFSQEDVSWNSRNPNVLSITQSGVYTALTAGSSVIIDAFITQAANVSTSVTIDVLDIQIGNIPDIINVGSSGTFTSTVSPSQYASEVVSWSSNPVSVLSVNASTGQYTAHAIGTVTITASINARSVSKSISIDVGGSLEITNVPDILNVGDAGTLSYTSTAPIQNPSITWTSQNPNIISIDNSGNYIVHRTANSITITLRVGSLETMVTLKVLPSFRLNDAMPFRIDEQALINTINTYDTYNFNLKGEEHSYTVYPLSLDTVNTNAIQNLSIQLDGYSMSDINSKGFFLITSSVDSSSNQGVEATTSNLIIEPFTRPRTPPITRSGTTTPQNQTPFDFDTAIEYNPEEANNETAATRTFMFALTDGLETGYCSTLFKKVNTTIENKELKIAIWLDRNQDSARSSNGKCNDFSTATSNISQAEERNFLKSINIFAEDFFTSTDSIYSILYQINNGHVWGDHNVDIALDANAELHIGIGNIQSNVTVGGFVYLPQNFKAAAMLSSHYTPEDVSALQVYMNIDLLKKNNVAVDSSSSPTDIYKFYSVFSHELQHITSFYLRRIQSSLNYNNIPAYTSVGALSETWFLEFLSEAASYLTNFSILNKLLARDPERKNNVNEKNNLIRDKLLYDVYVQSFNGNVFVNGIYEKSGGSFIADHYETVYMFASYLITNYGIEVFQNLMNNGHLYNEEAIFNAVQNSPFYSEYSSDRVPEDFNDLIHDFHLSTFFSVPINQDNYDIGPVKMFTYNLNYPRYNSIPNNDSLQSAINSFAQTKDSLEIPIMTFNLSISPSPNLTYTITCNTSPNVYACTETDTYTIISPDNTGIDNLDFTTDSWFGGSGPVLTTLHTERRQLQNGKADFIYLGGKLNRTDSGRNVSLSEGTDQDGNPQLRLNVSIPRHYRSSLVVVESYDE